MKMKFVLLIVAVVCLGIGYGIGSKNSPKSTEKTVEADVVDLLAKRKELLPDGKPSRFYVRLGDVYTGYRLYVPAELAFRKATTAPYGENDVAMIQAKLGSALLYNGKTEEGLLCFERADTADGDQFIKGQIYPIICSACEKNGQATAGLPYARKWVTIATSQHARQKAAESLGKLSKQAGKLDELVKEMQARVKKNPDDAQALFVLKYIYEELNPNAEKISEVMDGLIKRSTSSAEKAQLCKRAAETCLRNKDYPGAEKHLREAISLTNDKARSCSYRMYLARTYQLSEQADKAEKELLYVVENTEQPAEKTYARRQILSSYRNQKKLPDLIKRYEARLAEAPNNIDTLMFLADMYRSTREFDKARKSLEAVLRSEPENVTAMTGVVEAYTQTRNYAKADQIYESLLAADSKNAMNYLYKMGKLAVQMKNKEAITGRALQMAQCPPKTPQDMVQTAEIFAYAGRTNELNQWYQKALTKSPEGRMRLGTQMRMAHAAIGAEQLGFAQSILQGIVDTSEATQTRAQAKRMLLKIEEMQARAVEQDSVSRKEAHNPQKILNKE
ncbi:hypothetical protein BVY04_00340 [bacterium M21]|nr:hypothetical protein BVY04_00340 [bacterium M21]